MAGYPAIKPQAPSKVGAQEDKMKEVKKWLFGNSLLTREEVRRMGQTKLINGKLKVICHSGIIYVLNSVMCNRGQRMA